MATSSQSNAQRAKQAKREERQKTEGRHEEHEEIESSDSRVPVLLRLLGSRSFWTSTSTWLLILLGAAANMLVWVWISLVLEPSEQQAVLHYTVQSGVDLIGPETDVWFLPAAAAGLWFVNVLLAAILYRFERFLSYVLLSVSVVLQIVFFVGVLTLDLAAR